MKRLVLRLLKIFGAHKPILKAWFNYRFAKRNIYRLQFDRLSLRFSTMDKYSKYWFYPRYANGNTHEPAVVRLLCEVLTKEDTFIDVGAHIGFFTCVAAALAGRVYSLEMDPKCIPLIERNLNANQFTDVDVVNVAASNVVGKLHIPSLAFPNPALMVAAGQGASTLSVDAVTLDQFMRDNQIAPTFIKIDVEGSEFKVLTGMKDLLKRGGFMMLVEIHCEKLEQLGASSRDVLCLLEQYGWSMYEINEYREFDLKMASIDSDSELLGCPMLFATKDSHWKSELIEF
jgi:FkbM family methyltransferase